VACRCWNYSIRAGAQVPQDALSESRSRPPGPPPVRESEAFIESLNRNPIPLSRKIYPAANATYHLGSYERSTIARERHGARRLRSSMKAPGNPTTGPTTAVKPSGAAPRGQFPIEPAAPPVPHPPRFPWRFSDAGRPSAWIGSAFRRPKTCTGADSCSAANSGQPSKTVIRVFRRCPMLPTLRSTVCYSSDTWLGRAARSASVVAQLPGLSARPPRLRSVVPV
jgi:hypothetical protein